MGLARALSKLGFCSRSQAAELICEGRARLNGETRRDPETPVHLERDRIEVDRNVITAKTKIYLMMNKPRGVITTAADEKGRETVYSLLPKNLPWLGPVGRLDKASEGLLLFTNDSEWAGHVMDPQSRLTKLYHAQVGMLAGERHLNQLLRGVLADGKTLKAADARVLRTGEKNSWLEIALEEGKNRHIRRMFETLGIEVLRLIRVAIGPLELGTLAKGQFRPLTAAEKRGIDQAIRTSRKSNNLEIGRRERSDI